jgi:tight adherence protein C
VGLLLALEALAAGTAVFLVLEQRPARVHAAARLRPYVAAPGRRRRRGSAAVAGLAAVGRRLTPRRSESELAALLAAAGVRRRVGVAEFLALEVASCALFVAAGAALALRLGLAPGVLTVCALAGAGLLAPRMVVRARARSRGERIVSELPDALDLLAVFVSAGLGLEAAMAKLAETMPGPLAEELSIVLTETRVGVGRRDALERLAARVGAREVRAFVRAVVQGEQLGTSLSETLRIQATEARQRRRAAAEERAQKASVKMLLPTAVLIFPALFVFILAPAVLTITRTL